jgi:hypothetical protein
MDLLGRGRIETTRIYPPVRHKTGPDVKSPPGALAPPAIVTQPV